MTRAPKSADFDDTDGIPIQDILTGEGRLFHQIARLVG